MTMKSELKFLATDTILDKIGLIFRIVNNLYKDGYRCRYDPATLEQIPLEDGEECVEMEMCQRCSYKDRNEDPYCQKHMHVWRILEEHDPAKFSSGGIMA